MGDHLKHLETTLNLARDAGIQFKAAKSQLARAQILYVGYKASAKGWGPDPTKLKAVADFEIGPDSTINTVRQFIGMANQFSRFISDFSKKTAPLRALIKQDDDKEDKDELDGEPEGEKEPAEEPEDSEVRGTHGRGARQQARLSLAALSICHALRAAPAEGAPQPRNARARKSFGSRTAPHILAAHQSISICHRRAGPGCCAAQSPN